MLYVYIIKRVSKKKNLTKLFFFLKSLYIIINHPFRDIFDEIYTIGYYSGFCSSLNDANCANGGHFELSSKDEVNR
jgi:hypothetical protein